MSEWTQMYLTWKLKHIVQEQDGGRVWSRGPSAVLQHSLCCQKRQVLPTRRKTGSLKVPEASAHSSIQLGCARQEAAVLVCVWQPTPASLPGKSHGQRNLVGYIPRSRKESDTAEWLKSSNSPSIPIVWIWLPSSQRWGDTSVQIIQQGRVGLAFRLRHFTWY